MMEYIYILIAWLVLGIATTVLLKSMHTVTKFEAIIFTLAWPLVITVTAIYLVRRMNTNKG